MRLTDRHALLYCLSVTNDRKNLSNASVHVCVGVKCTRKQSDNCWSDDVTHTTSHLTVPSGSSLPRVFNYFLNNRPNNNRICIASYGARDFRGATIRPSLRSPSQSGVQ